MTDRNFDELAPRFRRNVYASHKGRIRLAVLRRDLQEFVPQLPPNSDKAETGLPLALKVLDAGGGQGQFAIELARAGHALTLCDVSEEMLALAREAAREADVYDRFQWVNASIQDLCRTTADQYDLVLCHALLEWLDEPQAVLSLLYETLKPGAHLSLIFYNLDGLIYKNLLRTNFKKIRRRQWRGFRGSLTPTHPLTREQVDSWLQDLSLDVLCESGIRVFSDYIFDRDQVREKSDEILEMELLHSRQIPYRQLGRYIHILCQKRD